MHYTLNTLLNQYHVSLQVLLKPLDSRYVPAPPYGAQQVPAVYPPALYPAQQYSQYLPQYPGQQVAGAAQYVDQGDGLVQGRKKERRKKKGKTRPGESWCLVQHTAYVFQFYPLDIQLYWLLYIQLSLILDNNLSWLLDIQFIVAVAYLMWLLAFHLFWLLDIL